MRTPPAGKDLSADDYAARHDAAPTQGEDFEAVCLRARQQHNLRCLQDWQPQQVLEVGCGPHLLSRAAHKAGLAPQRWVVVEPATRWAQGAREAAALLPSLQVIEDYIEHATPALAALQGGQAWADFVLVSGVVHETAEPERLLQAALRWLRPGGMALVSVPNALSFHRQLAVAMGMVERPDTLSERNRLLGQPRVYDPAALRALGRQVGLQEVALEGYLFKPFTHAQMAALMPMLGPQAETGLIELGRQFPQQAAEIALLARLSPPR